MTADEFYYPSRFAAAIFKDAQTRQWMKVLINEPSTCSEEETPYLAAAPAKKRRATRPGADDDASDDEIPPGIETAARRGKLALLERQTAQRNLQQITRVITPIPAPDVQQGYVHETLERSWQREMVMLVALVAVRVPHIHASIDTLKTNVMREGLKYMRDEIELVPSSWFQGYTNRRMVPFANQVIEAILILGVVPILYAHDVGERERWPFIPVLGTYVIRQYTVHGAAKLRFYWTDMNAYDGVYSWRKERINVRDMMPNAQIDRGRFLSGPPAYTDDQFAAGVYDPNVEIIHGIGYDIQHDGGLSSKVASLLGTAEMRARMQQARTIAESNAAAPPLITEHNPAVDNQQSKNFQGSYFVGASAPTNLSDPGELASRAYTRDAAMRQEFAKSLQTYQAMTGNDPVRRFGVRPEEIRTDFGGTSVIENNNDSNGVPVPWSRQLHLPATRVIRHMQAPLVSGDYVTALNYMDNEIAAVFGVPLPYLQGSALRSTSELVGERLSDVVAALKQITSAVLTHVYSVLFLQEDVNQYLTSPHRVRRIRDQPGTGPVGQRRSLNSDLSKLRDEDLFNTDAMRNIKVTFAKNPSENVGELQLMYGFDMIDKPVLCSEMGRRNNFDPTQMCSAEARDEPIEMRRFLVPAYAEYAKYKMQLQMQEMQLAAQERTLKMQLDAQERQTQLAQTSAQPEPVSVGAESATVGGKKRKSGATQPSGQMPETTADGAKKPSETAVEREMPTTTEQLNNKKNSEKAQAKTKQVRS